MFRLKIATVLLIICLISVAFAQPSQNASTDKITVQNLGPIINSPQEDHSPFLSHNGSILFFTSRRPDPEGHLDGDKFWFARHGNNSVDSSWQNPEYLSSLNDFKQCGSLCFDTNRRAYIAASETNDVDIWEVAIPGGKKLYPQPIPSPVSTRAWETSPTVTLDGNTIVFVSDRKDSKGNRRKNIDLFISHRSADGRWSEPQSLGPNINTDLTEGTPNISPDGQFLFFCSKSDLTARDIYFSKHLGTTDTNWSKPIKLPEYINSNAQDMCPMIISDGKRIIFASDRAGGYGGLDIYEADLPKEIQALIKDSYTLNKK